MESSANPAGSASPAREGVDEPTEKADLNRTQRAEISAMSTTTKDETQKTPEEEEVYSIFTPREKGFLVFLASLAALFSPLSANIYYAATTTLANDLHVSLTQINLTVTCYLIFQGLTPTLVGSLSDTQGRRPLYLACFVLYVAANIGLALQNNYAALFVLRCLQSSGSSGTVALASAVVSDITTSAKRGSYISYVSMGAFVGPTFGPVIGGLLDHFINWHAIFWFLAIFGGVTFIVLLIWLPETCRPVVGNGSIPPQIWNKPLMSYLKSRRNSPNTTSSQPRTPVKKPHINLLQSIQILLDKESGVLLLYSGIFFAGYYMVITGLPAILARDYHYSSLQIGLCYIPAGFGAFIAAVGMGRTLDWSFRRRAAQLGMEITKNRQQNLQGFPIEAVRLQIMFPVAFMAGGTVIGFGWLLEYRINIAGPLVFLFLSTFFICASFQGLSTLVVDLNRDRPSSASAAMNLVRCLLGAGASAAVVPLLNVIGIGWTCVIAAGIWAAMSPVILLIIRCGPGWREEKRVMLQAREEERTRMKETV